MERERSATIFLTGISGSGKSETARRLAKTASIDLIDLDANIERTHKKTIGELFSGLGERAFRNYESIELRKALSKAPKRSSKKIVIALGGGALMSASNRKLVKQSGIVVLLRISCAEAARRLAGKKNRPLTLDASQLPLSHSALTLRLREMLKKREQGFRIADVSITVTNLSPAQIATQITRKVDRLTRQEQ